MRIVFNDNIILKILKTKFPKILKTYLLSIRNLSLCLEIVWRKSKKFYYIVLFLSHYKL